MKAPSSEILKGTHVREVFALQNKVELCGVNTAKLKVLKNDEIKALLLRTKQGDKQAREQLIAGNLRLVSKSSPIGGKTWMICFKWAVSA